MQGLSAGLVGGLTSACLVVAGASLPASADPDTEPERVTAPAPTTSAPPPGALTVDSPEFIAAMETAQKQQETKEALDQYGILTGFPELRAGGGWVEGEDLLVVQYDRGADPARLAQFLAATETAAGLELPFDVEYRPVDFNEAELTDLAEEISLDANGSWSDRLEVDSIMVTYPDTETGGVVVEAVGAQPAGGAPALRSAGVPIAVVDVEAENAPVLLSRLRDSAPWIGGLHLQPNALEKTTAYCTMGFTWRKWGTGELFGGTANHCWDEDEGDKQPWYNWGVRVGGRSWASVARDTMLLRSGPASDFRRSVFVGHKWTTDARPVVGAEGTPEPADVVALSGGNSGLNVGTRCWKASFMA